MPAGRPPKYKTPEEMQVIIDQYFVDNQYRTDNGVIKRYTMSGLALTLGMSRRALVDYAHKDEFLPTIKDARLVVEESLEQSLYGTGVAGVIFNLKNNFGWKDQQEINANVTTRDATGLSDEELESIAAGRS